MPVATGVDASVETTRISDNRFDIVDGVDFLPVGFDDFAHLLDEIFAALGRAAIDDDLLDGAGFATAST